MQNITYKKIVGERYDSIAEVYQTCENRQIIDEWKNKSQPESDRYGAGDSEVSFDTSKKELLFGTSRFNKEFNDIKAKVDRDAADYFKMVSVNRNKLDVVGGSVSVGRALAGHPRAMKRRVADRRPKKVVEICYGISCPWRIPSSDRLKYGCVVMACAEALEKAGYGVAITLFADMVGDYSHENITLLEIPIKSYSSPFNSTKLQFPMATQAALFHLGRYWAHRFPKGFYSSCEGYAADVLDRGDEIVEYCDSKGAVFLSHTMLNEKLGKGDIDKTFKYIEKEIERISKLTR